MALFFTSFYKVRFLSLYSKGSSYLFLHLHLFLWCMVMSSITILIIYVGLELLVMFSERLKLIVDIMTQSICNGVIASCNSICNFDCFTAVTHLHTWNYAWKLGSTTYGSSILNQHFLCWWYRSFQGRFLMWISVFFFKTAW